MRRRKARLVRLAGGVSLAAELFERMEERGAFRHARSAAKEWLLASRTVLDSLIDVLDDDAEAGRGVSAGEGAPSGQGASRQPVAAKRAKGARKIEIAEE
ncbi:hypothetical protein [Paenibacillus methanolicus]|uniref:Uncharacterized protein n=1 Tax=Paenibacillus methanolicus TaxID=582686 RepID=A0A5S5CFT3_9BACL|nr:hypothetical protein [Paenibacillus methanolicus]TYP78195.1 hypothetical protein BCM02_102772 [Paenibacillus methanolicus]